MKHTDDERANERCVLLGQVDAAKRSSLRKLVIGTVYAVPAIASFSLAGLSSNEAHAYVSNSFSSDTGSFLLDAVAPGVIPGQPYPHDSRSSAWTVPTALQTGVQCRTREAGRRQHPRRRHAYARSDAAMIGGGGSLGGMGIGRGGSSMGGGFSGSGTSGGTPGGLGGSDGSAPPAVLCLWSLRMSSGAIVWVPC
jgi:hypothetical protein